MHLDKSATNYVNQVFAAAKLAIEDQERRNPTQKNQSAWDTILSRKPYKNQCKPPAPKASFVANRLFRPLSEIISSCECLQNVLVYTKSFPYKRQGISRVAYLKYHVENYLNELYVLMNRMIAYCKAIERAYKKSDCAEHVSVTLQALREKVRYVFEGYTSVRGAHVHEHRYSDHDFDRLATLELLTTNSLEFSNILISEYNDAYKEIRSKWIARIKSDLRAIEDLVNSCLSTISDAIVRDDILLIPKGLT